MTQCRICYENFTDQNCTCNLCLPSDSDDEDRMYWNGLFYNHLRLKNKIKCPQCLKAWCENCDKNMKINSNNAYFWGITIKCPFCRYKDHKKVLLNELDSFFDELLYYRTIVPREWCKWIPYANRLITNL